MFWNQRWQLLLLRAICSSCGNRQWFVYSRLWIRQFHICSDKSLKLLSTLGKTPPTDFSSDFSSPLSWELTAQSCCVGIWCRWGERCWVPPAPQHQAHLPLAAMRLTPAAGGLEIRWITFSTHSSGRSSCQMIPRPLVTSTVSTSVTARTAQCKQPCCGTLSAWS